MRKLLTILASLALLTSGYCADVANDILLSQRKPDNSGNIQRNIPAQNAITSGSLASFQESIGLGLTDSVTFANVTDSALTAGRVALAGSAGLLADDADLTFSGSRLTATDLTVTNFPTFSAGTATRVPFFSTAGLLADSSALTYNSGTGSLSATNFAGTFAGNTFTTGTGTLTIAAGKTLTANQTLTLTGTAGTTMTFPATSATVARTDAANTFTGVQTFSSPPVSTNGLYSVTATGATSSFAPIVIAVKSVALLTSGSPADIAGPISIPSGITRWRVGSFGSTTGASVFAIAETAAGTLAATTVNIYDTAGGAGPAALLNGGTQTLTGVTAAGAYANLAGGGSTSNSSYSTGTTLYIRQLVNSANAGTVSFYIVIWPMP